MKVIVLAAGIGSRLGNPYPKPLILLKNGCSILQYQLKNIERYLDTNNVIVVVGFKKELIMEGFPGLLYVYNDYFDTTNTAKSLSKALKRIENEDVLWLNGDVVFDHRIVERLIKSNYSCMAVSTSEVGEEEIKYTLNKAGFIKEVSKQVQNGLGEAVGVNLIKASDLDLFKRCLEICDSNDYFEKGIEFAIKRGLKIRPVDISDLNCVEVDFIEDLEKVNRFF